MARLTSAVEMLFKLKVEPNCVGKGCVGGLVVLLGSSVLMELMKNSFNFVAEQIACFIEEHGHGCTNCLRRPKPAYCFTLCQKCEEPCRASFLKKSRFA